MNDQTLHFAVSGKLWEGSLVMVDEETSSYWSHLLGEAMDGPLKGQRLAIIPSVLTDWKAWKRRHPETTVVFMERSAGHFLSGHKFVHGDLVMGLVLEGHARAWPLSYLVERHFVADELRGHPLLVTYDGESHTCSIFERGVDGEVLDFSWRDEQLRDDQTGSQWDLVSGRALEGPLAGTQLRRLPGMVSDPAAWGLYHEGGSMWTPRSSAAQGAGEAAGEVRAD